MSTATLQPVRRLRPLGPSFRVLTGSPQEESPEARDGRLVAEVRSGNREAYWQLVSPSVETLTHLLRPLARSGEDVQDLVQDALLRALTNLHLFEGGRFSTWLFRVGINSALTTGRRARVAKRLLDPHGPVARRQGPGLATPEEALGFSELTGAVRDAVSHLPAPVQQVLNMRYGQGLACKEIAQRLGKTPNAVSLLLFRAHQRLKAPLAAAVDPAAEASMKNPGTELRTVLAGQAS